MRVFFRLTAAAAFCVAASAAFAGEPPGDAAYGAYLAGECSTCHRAQPADAGGIPVINGMDYEAMVAALEAYRDGERDNPVMQTVAKRLGDEEIAALAAHYSGL